MTLPEKIVLLQEEKLLWQLFILVVEAQLQSACVGMS